MNIAYISIGSNIGERYHHLQKACKKINIKSNIIAYSSIYETDAFGPVKQDSFLNACLKLETTLDAESLMLNLLAIELKLGRKREIKWGPRIIDLDILYFNSENIDSPLLSIPHPELKKRKFVLLPLLEIHHDREMIDSFIRVCSDSGNIKKLNTLILGSAQLA